MASRPTGGICCNHTWVKRKACKFKSKFVRVQTNFQYLWTPSGRVRLHRLVSFSTEQLVCTEGTGLRNLGAEVPTRYFVASMVRGVRRHTGRYRQTSGAVTCDQTGRSASVTHLPVVLLCSCSCLASLSPANPGPSEPLRPPSIVTMSRSIKIPYYCTDLPPS